MVRDSKIGNEGVEELLELGSLVKSDRVFVDTSVVRGLEYYTGPVYEVQLGLATTQ